MTDKNHNDDAEFDLFLQGSGELAGKLKAIGEIVDSPGPSAELDAAILANIERALAQEASSTSEAAARAANDAVGPELSVRLPVNRISSQWMTRWRVPLGLAAGLFLGVVLHRSFQSTSRLESVAQLSGATKPAQAVAQPMSSTPQRLAELPTIASADTAKSPSANTALAEKRKDKSSVSTSTPKIAPPAMQVATNDTVAPSSFHTEPAIPIAAPTPQVVSNPVQRVEITGSDIRRVDAETPSPAQVITADDLKKSSATLSQTPSNFSDAQSSAEQYAAAPPVIALRSPLTAPPSAVAKAPAAPLEIQKSPQEWIDLIEENLKVGRNDEAVQNWAIFRKAYPDFTVRAGLVKQIVALQNHQVQK